MRNGRKNGASGTAVKAMRPTVVLDEPQQEQKAEEHPLTSRELDVIGRIQMPDQLRWFPEPIWPYREAKISGLIEELQALADAASVPELSWPCPKLRAMLERAIASARELLAARHAAEAGLVDEEKRCEEERKPLEAEADALRERIEKAEEELKNLVKEAQGILASAGLKCNDVSALGVPQSVEEAAPKPAELAGELGVPLYAPKTFWEQILSLPVDIAPWAVGAVVGTAFGLVAGFLQLRALQEFANPAFLVSIFLLGAVIAGTMAEGLATLVRIWVPAIIKRSTDLPAQLEVGRRFLIGGLILGCIIVACEVLLEALGFIHLHNLVTLTQLRLNEGVARADAHAQIMRVAAPVYLCLGLVVSAPLILLKVGRALHNVQTGLVEDYIASRIRSWKHDKMTEIAHAVVLAEDCDACRHKIVDLTSQKATKDQKLDSLTPSASPAQLARVAVLEEQARGEAGKFWQLFDFAVQPPESRSSRLPEDMPRTLEPDGLRDKRKPTRRADWLGRLLRWLLPGRRRR